MDRELSNAEQLFLSQCSAQGYFLELLNGIQGVSIFIKSLSGEIIFGNSHFLESVGIEGPEKLPDIKDSDLFPPHLVRKYRQDDQEVADTAAPKLNLVELFKNRQGLLQWFITHKYPVFSQDHKVIAVMGTIQDYEKLGSVVYSSDSSVLTASDYIQHNFQKKISIADLARHCDIPVRQLQRRFKQVFNVSPREYLTRHRIYFACEALRDTSKEIATIAEEAGFYDQSLFTRQFKALMNTTPYKYRKEQLGVS